MSLVAVCVVAGVLLFGFLFLLLFFLVFSFDVFIFLGLCWAIYWLVWFLFCFWRRSNIFIIYFNFSCRKN